MLAGAEISTLAAASNCRRGVELFKRGCAFAHKNWARGRRPNMACERRGKKNDALSCWMKMRPRLLKQARRPGAAPAMPRHHCSMHGSVPRRARCADVSLQFFGLRMAGINFSARG